MVSEGLGSGVWGRRSWDEGFGIGVGGFGVG